MSLSLVVVVCSCFLALTNSQNCPSSSYNTAITGCIDTNASCCCTCANTSPSCSAYPSSVPDSCSVAGVPGVKIYSSSIASCPPIARNCTPSRCNQCGWANWSPCSCNVCPSLRTRTYTCINVTTGNPATGCCGGCGVPITQTGPCNCTYECHYMPWSPCVTICPCTSTSVTSTKMRFSEAVCYNNLNGQLAPDGSTCTQLDSSSQSFFHHISLFWKLPNDKSNLSWRSMLKNNMSVQFDLEWFTASELRK